MIGSLDTQHTMMEQEQDKEEAATHSKQSLGHWTFKMPQGSDLGVGLPAQVTVDLGQIWSVA